MYGLSHSFLYLFFFLFGVSSKFFAEFRASEQWDSSLHAGRHGGWTCIAKGGSLTLLLGMDFDDPKRRDGMHAVLDQGASRCLEARFARTQRKRQRKYSGCGRCV